MHYQSLFDPESIMEHFGHGSQAVGCAAGVGNYGQVGIIALMVDPHDEHGSVGGRRRNNDFFGSSGEMSGGFFRGGEDPGGFYHVFSADRGPFLEKRKV